MDGSALEICAGLEFIPANSSRQLVVETTVAPNAKAANAYLKFFIILFFSF